MVLKNQDFLWNTGKKNHDNSNTNYNNSSNLVLFIYCYF